MMNFGSLFFKFEWLLAWWESRRADFAIAVADAETTVSGDECTLVTSLIINIDKQGVGCFNYAGEEFHVLARPELVTFLGMEETPKMYSFDGLTLVSGDYKITVTVAGKGITPSKMNEIVIGDKALIVFDKPRVYGNIAEKFDSLLNDAEVECVIFNILV